MANFDKGIQGFIYGKCTISISFPIDWNGNVDVKCSQCKMFDRRSGTCMITKELSEYPNHTTGSKCPLDFTGEIEKGAENV